jgi:CHASE3 domain sensor protein
MSWFGKITIGKKLGLGFGSVLAVMILSTTLSYWRAREINTNIGAGVPAIRRLTELQRDLNQTQSKGRQAILAGTDPQRKASASDGLRIPVGK